MTEENSNGMVMPVAPMYGGGYGNNGMGFGGDWGWIILILLLAGAGNWGGNGGFGGGNGGVMPYMWNAQTQNDVNRGFDNAALTAQLSAIQTAINANAMSYMQGFNAMQSQFAECCCENRLASSQTQNIVQNEANATRFADVNNTRDIVAAITSGIQSIKDDLCQDRLDAERRDNANLRQELLYARGQAADAVQRTSIVNDIYNRLSECPVGTVPVYGEQPIFTCPNNGRCCGSF